MESVKKEQYQLKKMETKRESAAGKMHIKLQKAKLELEETLTGEVKVRRCASEERTSSFYELVLDRENAKHEVEEMMNQAEKITKESEYTRIVLEEAGNNMLTALEEAEEVKTAEASVLEEIKWLSESGNVGITREEFESLITDVENCAF
ncbi:hypothetical protein Leryth_005192 [Lithospermum erythrorhizon]|nr:hypothetical protein Leryth_005192 [Lithospermum erythrorhizon]